MWGLFFVVWLRLRSATNTSMVVVAMILFGINQSETDHATA